MRLNCNIKVILNPVEFIINLNLSSIVCVCVGCVFVMLELLFFCKCNFLKIIKMNMKEYYTL